MRRTTEKLIVHCADTPPTMDIGVAEIDRWHKARGWNGCGYHFVIRRNGRLEVGRDLMEIGAHVAGHNHNSVGICLVGGKDGRFDFEPEQMDTLIDVINFCFTLWPDAEVAGHNEFSNKSCPGFDVPGWWYG